MKLPTWKTDLITGYQTFRSGLYETQKKLYSELGSKGQKPAVMVIACSDSRADPSDIFDTYPGEIFVLRNVANIVQPFQDDPVAFGSGSAIEFAVNHLKVKAIVVMGHADCGGIKAYRAGMHKSDPDSFIARWINVLEKAEPKKKPGDCAQTDMELAGVLQSIDNLLSYPFVKSAVKAGDLELMGAYFSIEQGKLLFANENGDFQEVPAKD